MDAPHLEKSSHLSNSLTDRHEIWNTDLLNRISIAPHPREKSAPAMRPLVKILQIGRNAARIAASASNSGLLLQTECRGQSVCLSVGHSR